MALGKDDQDHKNCSEGHHHCSHFLVVSYSIQSHVNPARALTRRLDGQVVSHTLAWLTILASNTLKRFEKHVTYLYTRMTGCFRVQMPNPD